MNQPLDLDAIQARLDAATDGPWHAEGHTVSAPSGWIADTFDLVEMAQGRRDATFVAAARTDVEQLLARVRQLEEERALYVGVEPTIAEEMAELNRRLDAVDAVVAQWTEHCLGTQTRFLLDDVRAAANGETRTQPTA